MPEPDDDEPFRSSSARCRTASSTPLPHGPAGAGDDPPHPPAGRRELPPARHLPAAGSSAPPARRPPSSCWPPAPRRSRQARAAAGRDVRRHRGLHHRHRFRARGARRRGVHLRRSVPLREPGPRAQPGGEWTSTFPFAACPRGSKAGDPRRLLHRRRLLPRDVRALRHHDGHPSALPAPGLGGLQPDDMVHAIDIATRLGCDGRVLMHGGAYPTAVRSSRRCRHDRHPRTTTRSRRGRSTRWCRPTRTSTSTTTTRRGRRSASASSTTSGRSVPRSSAPTRASRRSSDPRRSWRRPSTSGRPPPATPTSPSSSTTRASSLSRAARAPTTRTIRRRKVSTGSSDR